MLSTIYLSTSSPQWWLDNHFGIILQNSSQKFLKNKSYTVDRKKRSLVKTCLPLTIQVSLTDSWFGQFLCIVTVNFYIHLLKQLSLLFIQYN